MPCSASPREGRCRQGTDWALLADSLERSSWASVEKETEGRMRSGLVEPGEVGEDGD